MHLYFTGVICLNAVGERKVQFSLNRLGLCRGFVYILIFLMYRY